LTPAFLCHLVSLRLERLIRGVVSHQALEGDGKVTSTVTPLHPVRCTQQRAIARVGTPCEVGGTDHGHLRRLENVDGPACRRTAARFTAAHGTSQDVEEDVGWVWGGRSLGGQVDGRVDLCYLELRHLDGACWYCDIAHRARAGIARLAPLVAIADALTARRDSTVSIADA
jgi:hypothetical protein